MKMFDIPFNKPHFTGKETSYILEAVKKGHISGNGYFTKQCQAWFEKKYGFQKCLLTTSCTDALEMAAILMDLKEGDEVIMPSFTFPSTANAFILRGAKIIFADSRKDHPGMDESTIQPLITSKTKAIVPVHYAGVACDMDTIMSLSEKYGLYVVEDAAQGIDSFHNGKPLGGIGHLATFSFHETKNISAGEAGMLVINDSSFLERAEIIWEKGTNRAAFFRGDVAKYGWVDIGSSFLPSDLIAAVLWAQLNNLEDIQKRRVTIWEKYFKELNSFSKDFDWRLPAIPEYATNNGHMFYMVSGSLESRTELIKKLKDQGILSVFHYQSLHKSEFYKNHHDSRELVQSDRYSDQLIRLPFYYGMYERMDEIISAITN